MTEYHFHFSSNVCNGLAEPTYVILLLIRSNVKIYNVCRLQILLSWFLFFTLQPGTDALICAEVDGKVSVDHYNMDGHDQPTKTTPVSTNVCA